MVGVPPSASLAVAVQVSVLAVVMPLEGLMPTLVIIGAVFSTVTEALSLPVPPRPSLAVAVQLMLSPGELLAGVKVRLLPDPRLVMVVSLLQA